jgi:hypothetical protein
MSDQVCAALEIRRGMQSSLSLPREVDGLLTEFPIVRLRRPYAEGGVMWPGLVLAGGWLRDRLALTTRDQQCGNDADLFIVANSEDEGKQFAAMLFARLLSIGVKVIASANAITIFSEDPLVVHGRGEPDEEGKIQIIWRWCQPSPELAIDCFDFVCCKAAIWYEASAEEAADEETGKLKSGRMRLLEGSAHSEFSDHVRDSKLFYGPGGSRELRDTSAASFMRAIKFISRGWKMDAHGVMRIVCARVAELADEAKRGAVARGEYKEPAPVDIGSIFLKDEEGVTEGEGWMTDDLSPKTAPLKFPLEVDAMLSRFFVREDGTLVTGCS